MLLLAADENFNNDIMDMSSVFNSGIHAYAALILKLLGVPSGMVHFAKKTGKQFGLLCQTNP